MTPEQLTLVGTTVAVVEADRVRFSGSFYARLFALAPRIRALFPDDMEDQHRKLADGFSFLAGAVLDVPMFVARAHGLGAAHRRWGVRNR